MTRRKRRVRRPAFPDRERDLHPLHRDRTHPGRVFRVYPDPELPFVVEVRVARTPRQMRQAINFHEGQRAADDASRDCMGYVRSWYYPRTGQGRVRPRQVVARMFLNVRDLRDRPSEITTHEVMHAALAYARFRKANLNHMPGEEVACYAAGRLARQINTSLYAMGVFV